MGIKNNTRKGIYFSFDALLALGIMTAALVAIMAMMDITSDEFDIRTSEQQALQQNSQDLIQTASVMTYQNFDAEFQDTLLQETVMEEDDMERTILEGTAYLWASGNRTHAEQAIERFTESKIEEGKEFRVEVSEDGQDFPPIYQTTEEEPSSDQDVTSTSAIISGFRLNETSEGYRARARVLEATAQTSEIIPISPAGSILEGPPGNTEFVIQQNLEVEGDENTEIENAVLDIALSDGPSGGQTELRIDGEEVGFGEEIYSQEEMTYYRNEDIDDIIDEPGNYQLEIELASGQNIEEATRLQPGSRLEVEKTETPSEIESGVREVEENFQDITSTVSGGAGQDGAGISNIEDFRIPENSDIQNIELNMAFENLETNTGQDWDVQVFVNGQNVYEENADTSELTDTLDITDEVQTGNNIVVFYVQHDGETEFWGGDEVRIVSDSEEEDYTHLIAEYEEFTFVSEAFRASVANEIGDEGEENNPFDFSEEVQYEEVSELNIYLSQALGQRSEVLKQDEEGQFQEEFDSEDIGGQVPTLISLNPEILQTGENQFRIRDQENTQSNILPYTLFETVVEAPTSVGYGPIFDTPEQAEEDAVNRLEEQLGELIDAEEDGIEIDDEDDVESIGGQPRLWGPANLKLIMWEEQEETQ